MEELTTWLSNNGMALVALVLGSSVLTAILSRILDRSAAAAQARREGYVRAVRVLVARHEFPYRIRRRVSDEPAVLTELAKLGHDLQIDLAAARVWVASESPRLGKLYGSVIARIDASVGPACKAAWESDPVTESRKMNLEGWGPSSSNDLITHFQNAVAWRFGLRRLVPACIPVRKTVSP